jgi:hypothetical protein
VISEAEHCSIVTLLEVLDFHMGYESYLRLLSLVYLYDIFEFESNRCFQFSFRDFSLVYGSAFAQVTAHERIQHLYLR